MIATQPVHWHAGCCLAVVSTPTYRKHVTWLLPTLVWCHRGHKENTAPELLAACVLWALPSNGFLCHIAPSWRLFVPNNLTVYYLCFLFGDCAFNICSWFHCPSHDCLLFPRCSFSERYHCSLLKAARPKRLTAKVPVDPGVLPSFKVFLPFSKQRGRNYLEWLVLPRFWLFLR
jgi:hypothetical protein